jgi:hypothetical protein
MRRYPSYSMTTVLAAADLPASPTRWQAVMDAAVKNDDPDASDLIEPQRRGES